MRYDKQCQACQHTFEVSCKMAEKNTAIFSCPECESCDSVYLLSVPVFLAPGSITVKHPAEKTGFDRVLKAMDKTMGTNCYKG